MSEFGPRIPGASLPGKLQQAAETVKETRAEPQQPSRKKFPDLSLLLGEL